MSCRAQVYVPRLRSLALMVQLRTCPCARNSQAIKALPLSQYAALLGFKNTQQAARFALLHKVGGAGCRYCTLHILQSLDLNAKLEPVCSRR
jgi:Holliday junction resolvasome RuvABC DNA-binding subunit